MLKGILLKDVPPKGGLRPGRFGRVKAPALLAWGSRDGAVDIRSADMLREVLPHCELTLFPGVGHLPFEEVPGEFNERVLEFLSREFLSKN